MIVCITAKSGTLEAELDERFGRCVFFIFYNTETKKYEAFKNPHAEDQSGAGTKSAEFVMLKGVKMLISGHLGPNAERGISAAGIEFVPESSGTVKDIIEKRFK